MNFYKEDHKRENGCYVVERWITYNQTRYWDNAFSIRWVYGKMQRIAMRVHLISPAWKNINIYLMKVAIKLILIGIFC